MTSPHTSLNGRPLTCTGFQIKCCIHCYANEYVTPKVVKRVLENWFPHRDIYFETFRVIESRGGLVVGTYRLARVPLYLVNLE